MAVAQPPEKLCLPSSPAATDAHPELRSG
jgi:hypothetical protein